MFSKNGAIIWNDAKQFSDSPRAWDVLLEVRNILRDRGVFGDPKYNEEQIKEMANDMIRSTLQDEKC